VKILAASLCEAWYRLSNIRCRPHAAKAICFRASKPVARGSSRTTGRRCATGRCFHTGDICSDAQHANGSLLCACV